MADSTITLAEQLVEAAFNASCPPTDQPYFTAAELAAERKDARAAVVAVLGVLVSKAFPDEDVDYSYGCTKLGMDAFEAWRALNGEV